MAGFVSDLKIGKKIGNGAFGDVFEGTDPAHGKVAVKVLARKSFHDDASWPGYKAGYLAEAKNLSKATHRNVVQLHHVVEAPDGDSVLICMAFCPGGSLQTPFEQGPMSLLAVRKTGTEILMGLGAMHTRAMIHRDIKPANLLLNRAGQVQISDFGLVTDNLILGYASQAGYSDHVAYEVWHGKGTSSKSDIWAVGMTLFRLLHGRQWYSAMPDPRDIVPHGGFASTLKWLPHVPKAWRRVIRKMLNDDDSLRYQNSAQALKALANLPTAPIWQVNVASNSIEWTHIKNKRRITIKWEIHSSRKHEWSALSEPIGAGRVRRLGGSSKNISLKQVMRELDAYFEAA